MGWQKKVKKIIMKLVRKIKKKKPTKELVERNNYMERKRKQHSKNRVCGEGDMRKQESLPHSLLYVRLFFLPPAVALMRETSVPRETVLRVNLPRGAHSAAEDTDCCLYSSS